MRLPKVRLYSGVLLLLLVVGLACRFTGLNWDSGQHLHPDERFLCMTLPDLRWPHSVAEYFETNRAPLNPFAKKDVGFFVYGQLPLTLVKAISAGLGRDNYDAILLVGRALSALFDCGTVLFLFLIARRIGGAKLGLLAATFLSLTALHIQQAHFFTVDTFAVFFLAAAFYSALCWSENSALRTPYSALFAGAFFGAALACKISSVLFLAPLGCFAFLRLRRAGWRRALPEAALLLFVAFAVFRIAHPMAFRGESHPLTLGGLLDIRLATPHDKHSFWLSMQEQKEISEGTRDLPWNIQWIGRTDYVFPFRNLVLWGTGAPLGISALLGIILIFRRGARGFLKNRKLAIHAALAVAAFWCVLCFVFHGAQYSKFTRYYLPMTPFLCLCAAYLIHAFVLFPELGEGGRRPDEDIQKYPPSLRGAPGIPAYFCGAVLAATACWALAVTSIYTRPHSRIAASDWIRKNIAPQTVVANETSWDDTLPVGASNLQMLKLELYDPDSRFKRRNVLETLDKAQWIFISSSRTFGSTTRLQERYPWTTRFYQALFSGELGFAPRRGFTSYPQLFGIKWRDDLYEESLTVYDHPRVALFQKTAAWSKARAGKILDEDLARRAYNAPLSQWRDEGWKPDEKSLPRWPEIK